MYRYRIVKRDKNEPSNINSSTEIIKNEFILMAINVHCVFCVKVISNDIIMVQTSLSFSIINSLTLED